MELTSVTPQPSEHVKQPENKVTTSKALEQPLTAISQNPTSTFQFSKHTKKGARAAAYFLKIST